MYSFTVYQHKTQPTFRVVAGEHTAHSEIGAFMTRVYQGADRQQAIDAAYAGETDETVRSQIARFGLTEPRAPKREAVRRSMMEHDKADRFSAEGIVGYKSGKIVRNMKRRIEDAIASGVDVSDERYGTIAVY